MIKPNQQKMGEGQGNKQHIQNGYLLLALYSESEGIRNKGEKYIGEHELLIQVLYIVLHWTAD